jgi:hypothetical protein
LGLLIKWQGVVELLVLQKAAKIHLVTQSYFDTFSKAFGAPFEVSKNFEAFGNYCVFSKYSGDSIEVSDLVYDGADPGIDGAFLSLDDRGVFSLEELTEILEGSRREFSVSFVFTQVKSSTSWSKMEIDSFVAAMADFLSEVPGQPHSQ